MVEAVWVFDQDQPVDGEDFEGVAWHVAAGASAEGGFDLPTEEPRERAVVAGGQHPERMNRFTGAQ
jgi:hypothetical protein